MINKTLLINISIILFYMLINPFDYGFIRDLRDKVYISVLRIKK